MVIANHRFFFQKANISVNLLCETSVNLPSFINKFQKGDTKNIVGIKAKIRKIVVSREGFESTFVSDSILLPALLNMMIIY